MINPDLFKGTLLYHHFSMLQNDFVVGLGLGRRFRHSEGDAEAEGKNDLRAVAAIDHLKIVAQKEDADPAAQGPASGSGGHEVQRRRERNANLRESEEIVAPGGAFKIVRETETRDHRKRSGDRVD